jgi:NADH-quinone oxidoreductase subunit C/D
MVGPTNIVDQLRWKLGENVLKLQNTDDGTTTCWIARQNAHDALRFLKDEVDQPYRMLYDLTAIDERMRIHREGQPGSDFTIVYHLLSFGRNAYLRVKVPLKSGQPPIDTATDLWPAANWYEREVWDMFGIRFHGHRHLERILMPKAWVGHPLLKDYPERASEMGPQNPGTDGVLRVALELDGEKIVDAVPEIGFRRRGAEKMAERQSWHAYIPYTGQVDCLDGVVSKMAYLMAVEKLGQIEVPPRAKVIRVMLAELFRIINHLVWYQTFARDLGLSPVFSTSREREGAFAIAEAVCGARMHPNLFCIGGVANDLPKGWDALVRDFLKYLPLRLIEYDKELLRDKAFKTRTQGVGAFTTEEAVEWGVTGPNLRACGLEWDFRKEQPYSGYEQFEFDIPTGRHGDCYDRGAVRVEEMLQSLRIIEQCVDNMPEGQYESAEPLACPPRKGQPVIPEGEALGAVEAPEGNSGCYLVSDGGNTPYRIRLRTPWFARMQMLSSSLRGRMISDVLPVLGVVDYALADVNR